jgi:hypothetical protein
MRRIVLTLALLLAASPVLAAPPLVDFTTASGRSGWEPTHDIRAFVPSPQGLVVTVSGDDPYLYGPALPVPAGKPLWLRLRLKASQAGMGQVFTFRDGPTERDSVRFAVRANVWEEIRVPLYALPGPTSRFRIDPPGGSGAVVTLASLSIEPRVVLTAPAWPRPLPVSPAATAPQVRSGDLILTHGDGIGAFTVEIAGRSFAAGDAKPLLGYQTASDAPLRWLELESRARTTVRQAGGALTVTATFTDGDGGNWTLTQRFAPQAKAGGIAVETRLRCDRPRVLAHFPALVLIPGLGAFGTTKNQGLFAGVEYLGRDEPSSSEADLKGDQAKRLVPARHLLTQPLMAIHDEGRYVALAWTPSPDLTACFDSPDRQFHADGHLLGLLFPGGERPTNDVMTYAGRPLAAGEALTAQATILGGGGDDITAAVRAWTERNPFPQTNGVDARALLTAGWLDSGLGDGAGKYRHALPGAFGLQAAPDAGACLAWLAARTTDAAGSARLEKASAQARALAPKGDPGGVGHVLTPAPLLYTVQSLADALRGQRAWGMRLLDGVGDDGAVPYRPSPGRPDYGRTHFEKTANGLSASPVADALAIGMLTGDSALIDRALQRLRQIDVRWRGTVPRGAQTWEVPLHTPDILASAHLVRAFVLGYELTGDAVLLERAREWAWTGVPFVYLVPPTDGPVGLYATIAVLGATNWEAPNWIGLPVQWCGLVYADALYELAARDPDGPWRRIADGIVDSGVAQSFPVGSDRQRQGLLPDSFHLPGQLRNDPGINPATLQAPLSRRVGSPLAERRALVPGGPIVQVPGRIVRADSSSCTVAGWPKTPFIALFTRLGKDLPRFEIDGKPAVPHETGDGWAALTVPPGTHIIGLK